MDFKWKGTFYCIFCEKVNGLTYGFELYRKENDALLRIAELNKIKRFFGSRRFWIAKCSSEEEYLKLEKGGANAKKAKR